MSGAMEQLYQQLILDHAKHPHGKGLADGAAAESHQVNPTCGDEVTLRVHLRAGTSVVDKVSWDGQGCSISQASISMMSELVEGARVDDAEGLGSTFRELMRARGKGLSDSDEDKLGDATTKWIKKNTPSDADKWVDKFAEEAKAAAEKLTRAGVLLGNQAVLLRGVNADRHVMKKLMHELLKIKVRPYYIFNCKKLEGIKHFRASIEDGLNIMEYLRNYSSGLAVPTYICTLPNGRGKTPVMPHYLLNINANGKARFRSWQGFVVDYDDAKRDPDLTAPPIDL